MPIISRNQLIMVIACLIIVLPIGTMFIAGRTGPLPTTTSANYTTSETSSLGTISWLSQPPANSTNAALLSSAIVLMKGIYTYSPEDPNYLPTSYTNQNSSLTTYVVHATQPSSVAWAPSGGTQIIWKSVPGVSPRGWSGTVTAAGITNTGDQTESLHVMTDCSGFITALFAYANNEHTTKFNSWTTGSSIPEASCTDWQGNCTEPNPLNYYHLFSTGENGWFQNVTLPNLQPGDIIAFAGTNKDTGHIMLVAAVSNGSDNQNSRYVVVIDETGSPHSYDTRKTTTLPSGATHDTPHEGAGIGMGIVKLSISPEGQLQFFWGMNTPTPEIGSIALGRSL
ncbi:MAG: hypothetical protein ABSD99_02225 [Candidatus Bathyarchaeia archaeon]